MVWMKLPQSGPRNVGGQEGGHQMHRRDPDRPEAQAEKGRGQRRPPPQRANCAARMRRGDGQSPGGYVEGTARPPLGRGQALRGRAGVPPVWVPVTGPAHGSFPPSSPRTLRTRNPDTITGPGGHLTPSAPSTEDSTARTEGPLLLSPELTRRSGPSNLVEVTEASDREAPGWGSSVGSCLQTPRSTQPPELGWTVMSCTLEFQRKLLEKRVSAPHFTGTSLTLCGFRGDAGPGGEGGSATRS
ncbi:uncharacterized protein LOC122211581 [Panthera leo]|uniref:uncharacterized protein LOC122211581 n=1 Tax=Panthera leo TaxID=9689 RepID=UPI001C69EDC4|nr:uncharacterized protein LOC122211581 [Panthera leo]